MVDKKRNIKIKQRRTKPTASKTQKKSEPNVQMQQLATKKTKQKQKQKQTSNQNVNVKIHIGDKEKSEKQYGSSDKKQYPSSTHTIIPQYIQSLPPPTPKEPEPPRRIVNASFNPIRPNPIMTSSQSLDTPSSLPFSSLNFSNPRPTSPASSLSSLSMPSFTRSDMTDYYDLSDMSSINEVKSYPSYSISEPESTLRTEEYSYSTDRQSIPSSKYVNMSVPSDYDLSQDMPVTSFENKKYVPVKEDKYDDLENLMRNEYLYERLMKQRELPSPIPNMIYDDGSIQMLNESYDENRNQIVPFEDNIAEVMSGEIKRIRGRRPGVKNRPKEIIQQEKEQKALEKAKKAIAKEKRSEFFTNRHDELNRQLEERDRQKALREKIEGRMF